MAIDLSQARPAGLLRRLAAMVYDGMLLVGVLLVAVALLVIPYELLTGMAFPHDRPVHRLALQIYLLLVSGLYFTYPWVRVGQTLGMRAWRLRVLREDGEPLAWRDAWWRFFAAILSLLPVGLGYFWILVDPKRLAWHDRLSSTRLALTAKRRSAA